MTSLDIETTNLSDYEFSPPCEGENLDGSICDEAAEYIITIKCCGRHVLFCDECYTQSIQDLKDLAGVVRTCMHCDTSLVIGPDFFFSVDRL